MTSEIGSITKTARVGALGDTLRQFKAGERTGLVPYFPVGFPRIDSAVPLIEAAAAAGADIIELGVPFSDPLADGPVVQAATFQALNNGVTLRTCLDAAREARARGVKIPLVFMGYYNPIHHHGLQQFADEAAEAGVSGCIVPDLPPEEAGPLKNALDSVGLDLIPMIAPTSTDERIRLAASKGSGFVYCVSVTGVTGARTELASGLPEFIQRIRKSTSLPIGVGFGVSTRDHVRQIGKIAELAIIGSAVVKTIDQDSTASAVSSLQRYLGELLG